MGFQMHAFILLMCWELSLERKGGRERGDRSNNGLPPAGLPLGMELETPGT